MSGQERNVLEEWRSIVGLVHGLVEGLSEVELDRREDGSSTSIRETVHHLVEANLVAASIVLAALGSPGCAYDWSWMMPFGKWNVRLAYNRKPIEPDLRLLEALNAYVVAQIEPLEDGLQRTVQLLDQPGTPLRTATVAQVLLQEVDHAREHVLENHPPPSA